MKIEAKIVVLGSQGKFCVIINILHFSFSFVLHFVSIPIYAYSSKPCITLYSFIKEYLG